MLGLLIFFYLTYTWGFYRDFTATLNLIKVFIYMNLAQANKPFAITYDLCLLLECNGATACVSVSVCDSVFSAVWMSVRLSIPAFVIFGVNLFRNPMLQDISSNSKRDAFSTVPA